MVYTYISRISETANTRFGYLLKALGKCTYAYICMCIPIYYVEMLSPLNLTGRPEGGTEVTLL